MLFLVIYVGVMIIDVYNFGKILLQIFGEYFYFMEDMLEIFVCKEEVGWQEVIVICVYVFQCGFLYIEGQYGGLDLIQFVILEGEFEQILCYGLCLFNDESMVLYKCLLIECIYL